MRYGFREFYHVFNRGVEKRPIYLDDEDHFRFVHDLYEFNDEDAALNLAYYFDSQRNLERGVSVEQVLKNLQELQRTKARKLLVDLVCLVLMPNHFHLIAAPKRENGLSLFMQKLGTGYANYFNRKYERVGPLFQGTFKARHIVSDVYFRHCSAYIHRNPLELIEPDWKEKGIKDPKRATDFLSSYRWSSYPDYIGATNFPSVTTRTLLLSMFDNNPRAYKQFVLEWTTKEFRTLQEMKLAID